MKSVLCAAKFTFISPTVVGVALHKAAGAKDYCAGPSGYLTCMPKGAG
jgi:hypothetical protein